MRGSVHKRCRSCGRQVDGHRCETCGGGYTWGFVLGLPRGADDQRCQMRRSGFRTRREAEERLLEVLTDLDHASLVDPHGMTVAYLQEEWLPATKPPRVRWKTWNDRRQQLETHVIPRIGDVALEDLEPTHLNRLYATLLDDGRVHGEGGLAPSSVHGIHRIIRVALNDAVRWGLLRRNPALDADPPPMKEIRAARRRAMKTWSAELVFAVEDGSHPLPNRVTKAFLRATRRVGVPHVRFHGLRHTHGTLMAVSGINPKVIAERMGHSSVAFFLDTYGHVLPGMQPDAAERLADLVLGPDGSDVGLSEETDEDDDDRGTPDEHPDERGDAA